MKTKTLIAAAALSFAGLGASRAQTFVLDSPVILTSKITTQGEETTKKKGDTTIVTQQLAFERFNNKSILNELLKRGLITDSTTGWTLAYLSDADGKGGIYAKKSAATPVAVPADLLTLPTFGPTVTTGREITGPKGTTYEGTTDIAAATLSVKGLPAAGPATNNVSTLTATIKGTTYQFDTVSTIMTFTGGITASSGSSLVDGTIVIGSAKLSPFKSLP